MKTEVAETAALDLDAIVAKAGEAWQVAYGPGEFDATKARNLLSELTAHVYDLVAAVKASEGKP